MCVCVCVCVCVCKHMHCPLIQINVFKMSSTSQLFNFGIETTALHVTCVCTLTHASNVDAAVTLICTLYYIGLGLHTADKEGKGESDGAREMMIARERANTIKTDAVAAAGADPTPQCKDKKKQCAKWASSGECESNPPYMHFNCLASCSMCHLADAQHPQPPQPPLPPSMHTPLQDEPYFIHVPKNGGSVIKKVSKNIKWHEKKFQFGEPSYGIADVGAQPFGCTHYHMPPQWIPAEFDAYPQLRGDATKTDTFVVARNPYARLISQFM